MSDIHELAELYALDALDADEASRFESHLATCSNCTSTVRSTREVMAAVGGAAPVDPPPALKTSIMHRVSDTPQASTEAMGGSTSRRTSRPSRRFALALATAAAAAALVLAGVVWSQQGSDDTVTTAQQDYSRIMDEPDHVVMRGKVAGSGQIKLVVSREAGMMMAVTHDMPTPPQGMDYQVWALHDGTMTSVGLMSDATQHGTTAMMALPSDAMTAQKIAVSIEPTGGSQQPTSRPVAMISMV